MRVMMLAGAFTLLCDAETAWSDTLNTAQADPAVDAARAAALTTPPAPAQAPGSEFASLQPKGFNLALPSPADTIDPEALGMRRVLADAGIGFIGMNLFNTAYNTLQGSARSNNGAQQYNGQKFSYTNSLIVGVTYDLSRFGIPDGQFYVAGINTTVSWAPLGPNKTGLSQMTYYQTLFNKRLELKLGYTTNTWQFANIYVGGSLASSVFGPSGSIPIQGGMSSNSTPTPGINLKYWVTDKWYLQGAVQRSVNPDGLQAETQYNPTGFDWSTPNAGALYLG
jgi:porin